MRIEEGYTVSVDRHVLVIELDVTGSAVRMVGILMEADHEVPVRFDPVDTVVFVVNAGWVPEANLQSCGLHVVGVAQERRGIDIRNDVPRSSSRRAIAHVLTPGLIRHSVVNVSKESPLCVSVTTSKEAHSVDRESARSAVRHVSQLLTGGFDVRVEF